MEPARCGDATRDSRKHTGQGVRSVKRTHVGREKSEGRETQDIHKQVVQTSVNGMTQEDGQSGQRVRRPAVDWKKSCQLGTRGSTNQHGKTKRRK